MNIKVRIANQDDLEVITKLNQNLFNFEGKYSTSYNQDWPASAEGQTYFATRLNEVGGFVLLAESEGKIIGYVAISIDMYAFRTDNPMAEIENMYVNRKFQRKGVGSKLMNKAEKICQEKGVKRIKVETLDRNIPSLNFYSKHNFSAHNMILEKKLTDKKG